MSKLTIFRQQLNHFDFGVMKMNIDQVHKETKVNKLFIFLDMIQSELKYNIGYSDYHVFGFAKIRGEKRKDYMTSAHNQRLTRELNDSEYYYLLNDKEKFNEIFEKYLGRKYIMLDKTDAQGFKDFCSGLDAIFAKPIGECGGKGIRKIDLSDATDYEKLYNELKAENILLIESQLKQHPEMNRLFPHSVNTMRMVTIVNGDGAQLVYTLLRMGNGNNCMDNISAGGMYTPVNAQGKLFCPAYCDKTGSYYDSHPVTGTVFENFEIPFYKEAVEMVKDAAMTLSDHLKYIGWDVCITEDGPALIEGNNLPGYDMCQNYRHSGQGALPLFESIVGHKLR